MRRLFESMYRQERGRAWNRCPADRFMPRDSRLDQVVHTDTRFTFSPYSSLEAWERRKKQLRSQILIASGLFPEPVRCDLAPHVFDETVHGDFRTAKFTINSYPGFEVTGNLFIPHGAPRPAEGYPAILNPHGHWDSGRLEHSTMCSVIARCVNFAKMGFVAVSYDMVGYEDSLQVSHSFGLQEGLEQWGISGFGLQLWNSLRVLDFVCGLAYVNADKIGCTGASGGGTQAFMLAAVDDRIRALAPVNMVSLLMQGGCSCENAPLLRAGTNNLELAAMAAPRPMLLVGSSGDWTKDLLSVDAPAIRSVYALYGKQDRLEAFFHSAEHNYNYIARHVVYGFFLRQFMDQDQEWTEQPADIDPGALRLYPDDKLPGDKAIRDDRQLAQAIVAARREAFAGFWDSRPDAEAELKSALAYVLNLREHSVQAVTHDQRTEGDSSLTRGFLDAGGGERIPFAHFKASGEAAERVQLIIARNGIREAMERFSIRDDADVFVVEPFLWGSWQSPAAQAGRNWTRAEFFTAFNYADDVLRINDVYSALLYLRGQYKEINILAEGAAACLVCALSAFAPEASPYAAHGLGALYLPLVQGLGGEQLMERLLKSREAGDRSV